jgi:hypothetical protein
MGMKTMVAAALLTVLVSPAAAGHEGKTAGMEVGTGQCPVHLSIGPPVALTAAQWRVVREELEGIWQRYDVDLVCAAPAAEAASNLSLTVVLDEVSHEGQAVAASAPGLGWVQFLDSQLPLDEIHVSVRGTRRLVEQASFRSQPVPLLPQSLVDYLMAVALARVVAHELGHILLSTTGHSVSGLMRPAFTADAIVGSRMAFSLTAAQARQLRQVGHCHAVCRSR